MIDKFPVWSLKPHSTMMMRYMICPEREKAVIWQHMTALMIAGRSSDHPPGHISVWVVREPSPTGVKHPFQLQKRFSWFILALVLIKANLNFQYLHARKFSEVYKSWTKSKDFIWSRMIYICALWRVCRAELCVVVVRVAGAWALCINLSGSRYLESVLLKQPTWLDAAKEGNCAERFFLTVWEKS